MIENSKLKYNISSIEKCEYIQQMKKVYFNTPKVINKKCEGYKNRYTGGVSTICNQCKNLYRGDENE